MEPKVGPQMHQSKWVSYAGIVLGMLCMQLGIEATFRQDMI